MSSKSKKLSIATDIFHQDIEGVIRKIPLEQIKPSKEQPRIHKDVNIKQLANSLQEDGLLQPIIVTKSNHIYFIIAGERRYRAAKLLQWSEIECRILNKEKESVYKLAIIENIQRENLNPFEEANAFKHLKDRFSYTDQEIADSLSKSRNYVSEIISISSIPEKIQNQALEMGISNKNMLVQLAQAIKKKKEGEFLENYSDGLIKTVKDAKTFLKDNIETSHIISSNHQEYEQSIEVESTTPQEEISTPSNAIFSESLNTPNKNKPSKEPIYTPPFSITFQEQEFKLHVSITINKKIDPNKIIPYLTESLRKHT